MQDWRTVPHPWPGGGQLAPIHLKKIVVVQRLVFPVALVVNYFVVKTPSENELVVYAAPWAFFNTA